MEGPCVLCLEEHSNDEHMDRIKAYTISWQELNIKGIIEKHFWPMNDILLSSSWLCLTCWQKVKDFNEFYVSIETAHYNAGKLEEIKPKITDFGYLEPEILIKESINSQGDIAIKSELPFDEPNQDYEPVKQLEEKLGNDPLDSSEHNMSQNKGSLLVVKKETEKNKVIISESEDSDSDMNNVLQDGDSDMTNIEQDGDYSEDSAPKKRRSYIKRGKNYRDNDIFIMTHFKEMNCDLCQAKFEDFPDMQKHFLKVHKQIGYLMCCGRKFVHRNRLVDHIHTHLNPEHFKCDQCGKVLSDRAKLKNHILSVHRPNDVELKHYCDVCGKSFIKSSTLQYHKLTHLPQEEKKFPCTYCKKRYPSEYSLRLHIENVHLNKLAKICHICGLSLRNSTEYKAHINKHEGITKSMSCDICGLRLTSERGLKLHKESQHPVGGKQEHKCSQCPKVSPTLRALKKHIDTMHVKGYEHKCNLCEKAFKRPETLKEHIASHTGNVLYTCPWCPKTFNSNGNMDAHRKRMHPIEWEEAQLEKYF